MCNRVRNLRIGKYAPDWLLDWMLEDNIANSTWLPVRHDRRFDMIATSTWSPVRHDCQFDIIGGSTQTPIHNFKYILCCSVLRILIILLAHAITLSSLVTCKTHLHQTAPHERDALPWNNLSERPCDPWIHALYCIISSGEPHINNNNNFCRNRHSY